MRPVALVLALLLVAAGCIGTSGSEGDPSPSPANDGELAGANASDTAGERAENLSSSFSGHRSYAFASVQYQNEVWIQEPTDSNCWMVWGWPEDTEATIEADIEFSSELGSPMEVRLKTVNASGSEIVYREDWSSDGSVQWNVTAGTGTDPADPAFIVVFHAARGNADRFEVSLDWELRAPLEELDDTPGRCS